MKWTLLHLFSLEASLATTTEFLMSLEPALNATGTVCKMKSMSS